MRLLFIFKTALYSFLLVSLVLGHTAFAQVQPTPVKATPFCHTFNVPLTVGSKGADVEALNKVLMLEGITTTPGSATFNSATRAAVKLFQKKHRITPTGYVGPLTLQLLKVLYECGFAPTPLPAGFCHTFNQNLAFGYRGIHMLKLDQIFLAEGVKSFFGDNLLGPVSFAAVKELQLKYGLPSTGFVGEFTRGELNKRYGCNKENVGVVVTVTTDKKIYTPSEPVEVTIKVENFTTKPQTYTTNTSCTSFYIIGPFNSMINAVCTLAITTFTIPPGGSKTYTHIHTPAIYKLPIGRHVVTGIPVGVGGQGRTLIEVVADTPTTQPNPTMSPSPVPPGSGAPTPTMSPSPTPPSEGAPTPSMSPSPIPPTKTAPTTGTYQY